MNGQKVGAGAYGKAPTEIKESVSLGPSKKDKAIFHRYNSEN